MPERTNEEIIRAYLSQMGGQDLEAVGRLRHRDWTCDYPQSGERIRGDANDRQINEHYPGGLPRIEEGRVVGSEDRWVVTPSYTVERIAGSGATWWVEARVTYPDGARWFATTMFRLRDGLIASEVTYWSQPFEAPDWRAPWVERIPET